MDEKLAIERISETENLTDGLDDDDANWLLQWGTSRVGKLIAGIADDDAAGEKVNQLMAVMRSLNAIATDRAAETPAHLAESIQTLRDQYSAAFGSVAPHSEEEIAQLSGALSTMTAHDTMQRLLDFLTPPETAQTTSQTTAKDQEQTNDTDGKSATQ
ncbi:MAG TPA: hypothetical protein VGF38_05115 [Ktedonobacterales bacterium]|jgi:hypothetical protein